MEHVHRVCFGGRVSAATAAALACDVIICAEIESSCTRMKQRASLHTTIELDYTTTYRSGWYKGSTIAEQSLRNNSPRTFVVAHGNTYSNPFCQIGRFIRLLRYQDLDAWVLAFSCAPPPRLLCFTVRTCALIADEVPRTTQKLISRLLYRWIRESSLNPIDCPIVTDRMRERRCPCTGLKPRVSRWALSTSSRGFAEGSPSTSTSAPGARGRSLTG